MPEVYHKHKGKITDGTDSAFSLESGSALRGILDSDPLAERLVEYAVDCALSGTFSLKTYAISVIAPLLTTTTSWSGAALVDAMLEDLHTCLATRVNPTGADVLIWMGGPHVAVDPTVDANDFPVEEALWAAHVTDNGIAINVWPSPDVDGACRQGPGTENAVRNRTCGKLDAASCGFVPRSDRDLCMSSSDGYRCHRVAGSPPADQPVIRTRLKCKDWCTFYPECELPTQCRTVTGENDCKATPVPASP